MHSTLQDVVSGQPDAAGTVLGFAGGACSSLLLSLVTLTFLALFLLMEPDDQRPAVRLRHAGGRGAPAARARELHRRGVGVDHRQTSRSRSRRRRFAGLSAWLLVLPFPIVLAVITGLLEPITHVDATRWRR